MCGWVYRRQEAPHEDGRHEGRGGGGSCEGRRGGLEGGWEWACVSCGAHFVVVVGAAFFTLLRRWPHAGTAHDG